MIWSYFPEKASQLFKFWQIRDRLSLFRADLHEEGSFDEAVRGCDGVFHVAASMELEARNSGNAWLLAWTIFIILSNSKQVWLHNYFYRDEYFVKLFPFSRQQRQNRSHRSGCQRNTKCSQSLFKIEYC